MERGREGRRGGGGGGLVHAPRRPRTGFKDAAVGDDAEDMMDDVHNSRLRERTKKDGSGVSGGHGVATSIVGPSSRNKRKRQGSQEIQVHARNSPADEVEETTEDTEMGVSEDDDDPPPPIIPRRPGKPRPQSKFAEDGIAVDLPAVPRKARTAMGKRPQEAASASVAESPAHGAGAVAASTPAPSSTPSSSSIASLKPGRRTKPSGSKPRGHKLAKVSTPSHVSDQEVEVAEALFDLARMFTQPPPSVSAVDAKKESRASVNEVKSEAKQEPKVGGSSLPPHAPNGHSAVPSVPSAGVASVAGGSVRSNSSGVASAASPAPSPPAAAAGSVADGSKKKRPNKVRTRTEEGVVVQSRLAPSPVSAAGSVVAPVKDADLVASRPSTAERSGVKVEGSVSVPVGAVAVAVAPHVSGLAIVAPGAGVASSGMVGLASAVPGVSVGRVEKLVVDKKGAPSEKKIGSVGGKAELSISTSVEKRVSGSPVREKKSVSGEAAVASAPADVPSAPSPSLGVGAVSTKMEVDKRSPEASAGPSDVDHVPKRDIDLMVAPSKAVGLSSVEKDGYSGEGDVGAASEKRLVDAASVSVSEDRIRAERDREREEKERSELERGREKERERELERERVERDRRRDAESARELAKEAVKEREREKERERAELSKAGLAVQRSGKSGKAENGRAPKASDRAGSGPASVASTMPGSVAPGVGSVGAGVGGNVAVLPMSVGMLSWPAGMAGGLGYFPGAAAVSSAAVEDSSPAAQVSPYMMGGRATWKRCAMHVYIARFIDMQQQVNRHQRSFFAGGGQAYPKSYNLNVPLAPSESLFGGAGGGGSVGIVGGAAASGSTGGSGSVSANLEATERGLNAAAMAAAAAASMQGAKERAAYNMDMVSRKSPGQHQGSGQGAPSLSLQSGAMFGFPPAGSGSPSGGVVGGVSGGGGGAMGGTNLNLPPGPGPGVALSSGGGSSSALVLGPGGPVGGLSSVGSSGAAASASAALQQAHQAMMHQAMMQSGSFPFAQFPAHFGPATFSGPAQHMGAQQAAAAQFYPGGPYFAQHLVSPSQLQGVPPSGSAGGGPVSKLQQQQQQQQGGSRSFGVGVGVPPQSPSHSALQGGSHAVGRSGEREGSAVGENGSSGEGKFPMPRGSALGVGGSGGLSLQSGGSGASEYNLMSGLGKQSKSREPGPSVGSQGVSPVQLQGQGPHQHHYHGGAGAHLGGLGVGKGTEGATSQGFSVNMNMAGAMNSRGASLGPGPLGLAPVATMIAPQGHAMLQSMSESGRVHSQGGGSGHAHAQMGGGAGHSSMMQQGQQQLMQMQHAQQQQHFQAQAQQSQQQQQHLQQQSVQGQQLQQQQRGAPNARSSAGVGLEDSRGGADGSYSSGVGRIREREVVEDRKLQGKRVSGGASPLSRDVEGGGGLQSSPGGVGGVSRSVGTTLNLMAPINAGMGVRSSGPAGAALSVGAPMQAQAQAGAMAGSKSVGNRPKGSGGPGPVPGPTGGAVSGGPHMVGAQASFSERVPAVSGGSVGVGGKASPPRGLSVGGQNMVPGPVGRQGPVGQHAGAKASPSPSGRAALVSGATATPTAPGTNLQAVLAAAMAKNPQGQQPQRSSGNASANTNSNANASAVSSARPGAGPAGPPASSGASPLGSPAPPTKGSGANPAKSSSSGKSSFPASGKGGAGGGGKRASSPSSGGHVPSILGPSPLAQNMPSKSSQQPQVQMQGPGQWEGQLAPPQLLQQQQFHHHQQMMRQQQQMMQQQMFHHQQQQHQLQQSPHIQGSPSGPPHLQAPKQASHQQQGGHQPPPPPSPSAQAQQVSINQQNQQQQAAHAHLQQQASQPQFVGPSGNGSLSFSSGLSMGAGNSGSGGVVGVGRSSYSESAGGALNVRPLQSVKPSGSGSNPGLNGVGQRGGGPGAGPVFLQQFGSSVPASSGQQQSGSPRGGNASGYSPSQGNAISGAGGRAGDGKSFPDGGQEQVNGVRMAPGSAQARGVAPMAASSPGAPGSSQRAPSGGSGSGPGPGGVAGPAKAGGSGGGQYNGFGDVGQLRPGMMSNSGSVSGSGGGMSGSGTNVQSVGNGRPGFSGGSLHVGGSGQGQIQAASSLAVTGPAVVPSGPAAVLGPQPTTSVVQQ